jgi:transcriptional regulator with XRE-family HTH domain
LTGQRGLTQAQIADKLSKPQSFISKYERGERRLDFTEFIELASLMDISVEDFLHRYKSKIDQITIDKLQRVKK